MMKKKIPLGISDYKKLIDGDYYYVDKTLLIQELLDLGCEVALLLRPRRFGKTVNISMLRHFFERLAAGDNSYLFSPFQIWQQEKYRQKQGLYPVVYLTLKDVKYDTWTMAYEKMASLVADEYQRHDYLSTSVALSVYERAEIAEIMNKNASQVALEGSLLFLTRCLYKHFEQKVVVLIDEYDAPVHSSYSQGYYEEMLAFMRNWLSNGLKDNSNIERGVLTGILRVARESVFSGLNNVIPYTLFDNHFSDKFGLLDSEITLLLAEYGLEEQHEAIRSWYNGYLIGTDKLYNPWSILQCVSNAGKLMPYWLNTSDNAIVRRLITRGSAGLKSDLELLLQGKELTKPIQDGMEFRRLENDTNAVWTLLLFSGYLTMSAPPQFGDEMTVRLKIPNKEVTSLYETIIQSWFNTALVNEETFSLFLKSVTSGDVETFEELFQTFLVSSMSYHDIGIEEAEKVYHAFVLGMLLALRDRYEVRSNRESGFGRYDVVLIPKDLNLLGVIFEFKKINLAKEDPQEAADKAIQQIIDKKYAVELYERGVKKVLALGLVFYGKNVVIKHRYI